MATAPREIIQFRPQDIALHPTMVNTIYQPSDPEQLAAQTRNQSQTREHYRAVAGVVGSLLAGVDQLYRPVTDGGAPDLDHLNHLLTQIPRGNLTRRSVDNPYQPELARRYNAEGLARLSYHIAGCLVYPWVGQTIAGVHSSTSKFGEAVASWKPGDKSIPDALFQDRGRQNHWGSVEDIAFGLLPDGKVSFGIQANPPTSPTALAANLGRQPAFNGQRLALSAMQHPVLNRLFAYRESTAEDPLPSDLDVGPINNFLRVTTRTLGLHGEALRIYRHSAIVEGAIRVPPRSIGDISLGLRLGFDAQPQPADQASNAVSRFYGQGRLTSQYIFHSGDAPARPQAVWFSSKPAALIGHRLSPLNQERDPIPPAFAEQVIALNAATELLREAFLQQ